MGCDLSLVIVLQFPSHSSYFIQTARLAGLETSGLAVTEINVLILPLQHANAFLQCSRNKTAIDKNDK